MRQTLSFIALLLYSGALVLLASVWQYGFNPGPGDPGGRVEILIPEGAGLRGIKKILVEKNIVRDDIRFELLAFMMQLAHRLKAGEYEFPGAGLPYYVFKDLEKGSTKYRSVTVPEGASTFQIATLVEEAGIIGRNDFLAHLTDHVLIRAVGLETDSLEGYLFPDTYRFSKGTPAESIIRRMVERFHRIYDTLQNDLQPAVPLTRHQIITLASIVEKESGYEQERGLIARVFLNRLEQGMPLQADPTVIYGLEQFDGNLRKKDLKTYSPYNTYVIGGLPPGPIANPGRTAIAAVLHPAEGKYLYFVSKNDGTHQFSETLKEHNQAVKTYQIKGTGRQGK